MNAHELVQLQVELEYRLSSRGRLVPFPGSTEQSRFIVYEVSNGHRRFFREDLPDAICAAIEAIPADEALGGSEKVRAILSTHAPCGVVWRGKSYFFRRPLDPKTYRDVVRQKDRFVITESGEVVSWAFSARENGASAEAAVETLPQFRRRGFAKATVSAWAEAIIRAGKVAFFSHTHDNAASGALARSLGVERFTTSAAYD